MAHVYHEAVFNPHSGKVGLTVLFAVHAQSAAQHKVGPQVLEYHLVHTVVSGQAEFSPPA
ncbi:hypothetical protein SAMN04487970_1018103 [Paenibacillus tianmuensis]|uniref:Uncharacterized protein n=1 Tax=Paenibacillus tianmuensis TaxID=624147 RepID=A0A1G4RU14_9BACL|nr:hypothetical protein [Paenibacillus tianmuensis]SCW59589.1 hypothetical protein SAMN04487970_1018103 [Paenibacillus tianmuensis]